MPESKTTPGQAQRLEFDVEGMHCASCVNRIEGALQGVPGVSSAAVNLATGRATIEGVELDPQALEEAIGEAGYEAHGRAGDGSGDRDRLARLTLDVSGMHCASCVSSIEGALLGLHGVAVMSVREGLEFGTEVLSDSAPLHGLVAAMLAVSPSQSA